MAINAINGIAVDTDSVINGISGADEVNGIAIESGGSASWTYSIAIGDTTTGEGFANDVVIIQPITLPAGDVTKLAVGVKANFGGSALKVYLADTSGNLIIDGVTSTNVTDGTYAEATVTSTPIAGGSYWVCFIAASVGAATWGYSATGSAQIKYSAAYASAPYDPQTSDGGTSTVVSVGVYVEP